MVQGQNHFFQVHLEDVSRCCFWDAAMSTFCGFLGTFVGGDWVAIGALISTRAAESGPPWVSAVPGKRGMNIMNSFMNVSCLQLDR